MKYILWATLLALSFTASAGNDNANSCGNNGNNCGGGAATANGGSAQAGALAGAAAGAVSGSSSSVGDVTNVAAGGRGGDGGNSFAAGGSAQQGQHQTNASTNVLGQAQSTDASSTNDNRSSASGNATTVKVEGDVYEAKRNAPGIVGGNVFPTASCKGGFSIGGSGPAGGGLLNIAITDRDCVAVLLAQTFQSFGDQVTACELVKSTKAYARQVKRNPAIKAVCSAK